MHVSHSQVVKCFTGTGGHGTRAREHLDDSTSCWAGGCWQGGPLHTHNVRLEIVCHQHHLVPWWLIDVRMLARIRTDLKPPRQRETTAFGAEIGSRLRDAPIKMHPSRCTHRVCQDAGHVTMAGRRPPSVLLLMLYVQSGIRHECGSSLRPCHTRLVLKFRFLTFTRSQPRLSSTSACAWSMHLGFQVL